MEYNPKLPIANIYVGKANVRTRQVDAGVDELAANISRHGLLHPVIVFKIGDKYELIVGQRRYLAFKKLGWETIPAFVSEPVDETKKRIISLSEGIHRVEIPSGDLMDAIGALWLKYGSAKLIAEELGIKESKIRDWIPLSLAPEPAKEAIKERKVKPSDVKKALKAGGTDEKKIMEIISEMPKMTAPEKRRLVDIATDRPQASAKELINDAKKPSVEEKVIVHLTPKWGERLDVAAKDLGMDREDVAKTAVIDWLSARGYG